MKRETILVALLTSFMLYAVSCSQKKELINIIPRPLSLIEKNGYFEINKLTKIILNRDNAELRQSTKIFQELIKNATSIDLPIIISESVENNTIFIDVNDSLINDEAYLVNVSAKRIFIRAKGSKGIFYALQTLRQLLPEEVENKHYQDHFSKLTIPAVEIKDAPRFSWRGINVDVARHFFSKDDLIKFIDLIALYKINILHLHLADDQAWRIEIKKYPGLVEKGAYRSTNYYLEDECKKYGGPYMEMDKNLVKEKDGQQVYGGYYTQDEMKEIIDYALEHKINILPEIDMPAHSGMAISIFPQLNCENKGPICPCNDFSYEFARNVFSEIIELFPYEYIHLGCDEVDRNSWANSYACKKFMKDKGISDVEQLQSFFTREMEKFFNSKGKKLIGWDEILEGGISKTATAMYWRTWIPNNLNNILKYGNNVIVASTSGYYLNYQQNNLSLKHTYEYQPVPTDIDSGKEKLICGIHASLWSEVIPNVKRLEYMAFPRVIAFSETAWTDENQRNWEDFLTRIHSHFKRLDALDVHYRLPDLTGFIENNLFVGEGFLVVNKPVEETEVRYTNDGSIPDRTSPVYKHPVKVKSPVTFNIGYFRPSGELYETYRAEFTKKEKYLASADISPEGSGLIRKYFKDNFNPENLKKKDISPSIALPEILDNQFGLIFSGYIKTKQSGIYTFYLTSHDGSILKIDDQIIVDNSGSHESIQKSGQAAMREGYHKFELSYWKTGYEVQLQLQFSFNGKSISEIENRMLFH